MPWILLIPTYTRHHCTGRRRVEKGASRGQEKGHRIDRGLFTGGQDGRGKKGWVNSDQLHADLQRRSQKKHLPGERHTQKKKVRATV